MADQTDRDALAKLIRERNVPPDARTWEQLSEGVRDNWRRDADFILGSDWLADHDRQVQAKTLRDARADLAHRMEDFAQGGRNTRAGWALVMLDHLADQIEGGDQ